MVWGWLSHPVTTRCHRPLCRASRPWILAWADRRDWWSSGNRIPTRRLCLLPTCVGEPADYQDYCFAHSVYPRVCGGTLQTSDGSTFVEGLSPRVRGNRCGSSGLRQIDGSIPACAGEPMAAPFRTCAKEVYPRVCGGTGKHQYGRLYAQGLSPRVRGNRFQNAAIPNNSGSIPACAGEPRPPLRGHHRRQVYPRVCGGTALRLGQCNKSKLTGLSPRVRGNPALVIGCTIPSRSIPACAGEPGSIVAQCAWSEVYPRVCGGTTMCSSPVSVVWGLSPACAGEPIDVATAVREYGVPACAGEPLCKPDTGRRIPVYPRVCGGTNPVFGFGDGFMVYPRVCGGTLPTDVGGGMYHGSIPACAGEPCQPTRGRNVPWVYPRVCGGTARINGQCRSKSYWGSIPACAGEPRPYRGNRCHRVVYPRVCGGNP